MNWKSALTAMALSVVAAAPMTWATSQKDASEEPPPSQEEAKIPFAARDGIHNWQAIDRDTVLIEARGRKWYRAELMGSCPGIQHAIAIGFDYEPDGSFDRFSALIVDGFRCPLKSLIETQSPRETKEESKPQE